MTIEPEDRRPWTMSVPSAGKKYFAKATSDVRESPMRGKDSQGRALPIGSNA